MRPKKKPEDWYTGDPIQYAWASRYWRNLAPDAALLGVPIHAGEMLAVVPVLALEQMRRISSHPEGRAFLVRMRKAWGKQTDKAKGKKGNFSYSMSPAADAHLAQIARWTKCSKSAVLEDLIQRGYHFEEQERAVRRQALAQEIQGRRNSGQRVAGSKPGRNAIDAATSRLTKELDERKALSSSLLFLCAQREVLLESMPASQKTLSRDQELSAKDKHLALMDYYEARIQASMAFEGSLAALPSSGEPAVETLPVTDTNQTTDQAALTETKAPAPDQIPQPGVALKRTRPKIAPPRVQALKRPPTVEVQAKKTRVYAKRSD